MLLLLRCRIPLLRLCVSRLLLRCISCLLLWRITWGIALLWLRISTQRLLLLRSPWYWSNIVLGDTCCSARYP